VGTLAATAVASSLSLSCVLRAASRIFGSQELIRTCEIREPFRAIACVQSPNSHPERIALLPSLRWRIFALSWPRIRACIREQRGGVNGEREARATFIDSVALVRSLGASIEGGEMTVALAVAVKKSHHRPRTEAISFVGLSPTFP